jgi:hypothetical protein
MAHSRSPCHVDFPFLYYGQNDCNDHWGTFLDHFELLWTTFVHQYKCVLKPCQGVFKLILANLDRMD